MDPSLPVACIIHLQLFFFCFPRRHRPSCFSKAAFLNIPSLQHSTLNSHFATLLANDSSFVDTFLIQQLHPPLFARPSLSAAHLPLAPEGTFALTVQAQTDSDTRLSRRFTRVSRLRTTIHLSLPRQPLLRLESTLRIFYSRRAPDTRVPGRGASPLVHHLLFGDPMDRFRR